MSSFFFQVIVLKLHEDLQVSLSVFVFECRCSAFPHLLRSAVQALTVGSPVEKQGRVGLCTETIGQGCKAVNSVEDLRRGRPSAAAGFGPEGSHVRFRFVPCLLMKRVPGARL